MNLHELKIWIDGFCHVLKDQAPNKKQWQYVRDKINKAQDASTKNEATKTGFLTERKK